MWGCGVRLGEGFGELEGVNVLSLEGVLWCGMWLGEDFCELEEILGIGLNLGGC